MAELGQPLPVENSPAGRAFRTAREAWRDEGDGGRLWLPLLHGAERLGVLELRMKAGRRTTRSTTWR